MQCGRKIEHHSHILPDVIITRTTEFRINNLQKTSDSFNTEIISLPSNNSIDMASSETQAKTVNYNEIMNCGNSDDYDEGYSSKYNLDLVDFISNDHMSSLNHPLHPQAIDKDKTSSSTHQSINYSSPMNSFNPQYSMLSLSKSQIRPELYQLAFDVQTDHDGQDDDDDQQQSSSDWSTVIIDGK